MTEKRIDGVSIDGWCTSVCRQVHPVVRPLEALFASVDGYTTTRANFKS